MAFVDRLLFIQNNAFSGSPPRNTYTKLSAPRFLLTRPFHPENSSFYLYLYIRRSFFWAEIKAIQRGCVCPLCRQKGVFEEDAIPNVESNASCIMVASVIKDGVKDHLFYVSNTDAFLSAISKYKKYLNGFDVELEQVSDPKWAIYDDFPDGT